MQPACASYVLSIAWKHSIKHRFNKNLTLTKATTSSELSSIGDSPTAHLA